MKQYLFGAAAAALALAVAPTANATTFNVGSPNFFLTSGTPFSSSITAAFFNSFASTTASFDDTFQFTIPQDGMGSGSISTSFSSNSNKLTITDLIINGVAYAIPFTGSGQSATVGGIPIVNGFLNTIQVKGFTTGAGVYSGTATFTAGAVPEPASWALMIAGFGLVGAAYRRRRMVVSFS